MRVKNLVKVARIGKVLGQEDHLILTSIPSSFGIKQRPIIDQTGTCYYKTGKVISKYLKPLTKNEFVIDNTQVFPAMLNNIPLSEDKEDVSYDVESLFINIPIKDTIDFICEEIYVHKKLEPTCKKSIFKKPLCERTTECTSSATGKLQKQVDGVSMGGNSK